VPPEPAVTEIALLGLTLALGLLAIMRVVRETRGRLAGMVVLVVAWLTGLAWRVLPFNARDVEMGAVAGWNVVYFPGDAPWADVLLLSAEVSSLLAALLWAAAYAVRRLLRLRTAWENVLAAPILLGLASVALATGAISSRHFGEWRELRALLGRYRDTVAREAPDRNRLLSHGEYEAIRDRLVSTPATFVSRGFREPLKIRMMQGSSPYVGVDFGAGRNAVFDLTTMICIYSD
jgi:hypothetical protein